MTENSDWPLDLIARSRRGELSANEERQLQRCLRASPTLRVAHLVGGDFDRVGEVEPGDDEQVRQFVADAMRRRATASRRWRGPRRLVGGLLAAALLLSGTTAFGWWRGWVRLGFAPAPAVATAASAACPTTVPVDSPRRARPAKRTPDGSPSARAEGETAAADPLPRQPRASARPPLAKPRPHPMSATSSTAAFERIETEPVTAETLFSSGNEARRAGQSARAIALFQELQQRFPASAEARLSRLSLGRIWLAQGRAQAALEQFDGYLGSGGPLTEEALLGKARSLAALGRFEEERTAWQTLQRRFPTSVYRTQAEERLRQLDVRAGP